MLPERRQGLSDSLRSSPVAPVDVLEGQDGETSRQTLHDVGREVPASDGAVDLLQYVGLVKRPNGGLEPVE